MFRSRSRSGEEAADQGGTDPAPPDAALASAAREDPRAFTPLYQRYAAPVYRYCYVRLRDREAAEDATSDVFLRALAGIEGYRGGHFAAWLFRIARNVVVDAARRRRPSEPIEAADEVEEPSMTPEEATIARTEREALRAAVAALPDQQRAAIELRLAGWSREQIAAALGKSPEAVAKLRFRAIQRLRRHLLSVGEAPQGGAP